MRLSLNKNKKRFIVIIIAAALILPLVLFIPKFIPKAEAASAGIYVDAGSDNSWNTEMRHYASGFLYGLGEPDVPTVNSLLPLRSKVMATKANNGLQHPNGSALRVADTYFAAGGESIQIYMTDVAANFPYEQKGATLQESVEIFGESIREQVREVYQRNDGQKFTFIPFNEPDWIWFNLGNAVSTHSKFFNAWKYWYDIIKSEAPGANIGGPNMAYYNGAVLDAFLKFTSENGCVPQVMTWHELDASFHNDFNSHYGDYRTREAKYLDYELPVVVNEYAIANECSNGGRLISYISGFEKTGVYGCLPYWNICNNLNDLLAGPNMPNGAWWAYKWYGDMEGKILSSTPRNSNTLKELACYNANKKSINILFGGADGGVNLNVAKLGGYAMFKDKAYVKVLAAKWTGYEGVLAEPDIVFEGNVTIDDNELNLDLDGLDERTSYFAIIAAPNNAVNTYTAQPVIKLEAEKAVFTGGVIVNEGNTAGAVGHLTLSGRQQVEMNNVNANIKFNTAVPAGGLYRIDLHYATVPSAGADLRDYAEVYLRAGGKEILINCEPSVSKLRGTAASVYIELDEGNQEITVSKKSLAGSTGKGYICCDRINLTLIDREYVYEPEEGYTVDAAVNVSGIYSGSGYVSLTADASSKMSQVVAVKESGMYGIGLKYRAAKNGTITLSVDNNPVYIKAVNTSGNWKNAGAKIFLQEGVNIIDIKSNLKTDLDSISLEITDHEPLDTAIHTLTQTKRESEAEFTLTVNKAGIYAMVVYYANNEQVGDHMYNVDVVDRYGALIINGTSAGGYWFRNTYSWKREMPKLIYVDLAPGDNIIKFVNDGTPLFSSLTAYLPDFVRLELFELKTDTADTGTYTDADKDKTGGCKSKASVLPVLSGLAALLLLKRRAA